MIKNLPEVPEESFESEIQTPQVPATPVVTPIHKTDNSTRFIGIVIVVVVLGAFLLGLS